jgi:hypothetical protein
MGALSRSSPPVLSGVCQEQMTCLTSAGYLHAMPSDLFNMRRCVATPARQRSSSIASTSRTCSVYCVGEQYEANIERAFCGAIGVVPTLNLRGRGRNGTAWLYTHLGRLSRHVSLNRPCYVSTRWTGV